MYLKIIIVVLFLEIIRQMLETNLVEHKHKVSSYSTIHTSRWASVTMLWWCRICARSTMIMQTLCLNNTLSWIVIVLFQCNNNQYVDILFHPDSNNEMNSMATQFQDNHPVLIVKVNKETSDIRINIRNYCQCTVDTVRKNQRRTDNTMAKRKGQTMISKTLNGKLQPKMNKYVPFYVDLFSFLYYLEDLCRSWLWVTMRLRKSLKIPKRGNQNPYIEEGQTRDNDCKDLIRVS